MSDNFSIENETENLYKKLKKEAEEGGYYLNPDLSFTMPLIEGLIVNEKRYGYQACPCRLASEKIETDRDIICPCIYRDPDLSDYNTCYCGLYVSEKAINENLKIKPIPDRHTEKEENDSSVPSPFNLKYPVWRCTVCGYICARNDPPERCPICKVTKDRFELFI